MKKEYSLKSVVLTNYFECFEKLKRKIPHKEINVSRAHTNELIKNFDFDRLKEVNEHTLDYRFSFMKDQSVFMIEFSTYWQVLYVTINGLNETIEQELYKIIESILELTPPTQEDIRSKSGLAQITNVLWQVYDKIEELKSAHRDNNSKTEKNCFLSFRFDDHSKSLAFELKEFLELTKIKIISGLGYEPRSVSEKVLSRLSQPIDLFILINSQSGDSAWINQEIGIAKSKGIPILVLNEEGTEEKSNLLGDNEYIIFPKDNISKSFIGVLQAIEYINKK